MNRWTLVTGLLVPVLILMSGCHWTAPRYCPSDHYHSWDPVLGSCDACGACGGGCEGHTPSSYTKHMLTCAAGCGEIYWGEWTSDPPDPCDPCDNCGNWIGPQPCGPSLVDHLAAGWCSLWGYRCAGYGYGVEASGYHSPPIDVLDDYDVLLEPDGGIGLEPGDDPIVPSPAILEGQTRLQRRGRGRLRTPPISVVSERHARLPASAADR